MKGNIRRLGKLIKKGELWKERKQSGWDNVKKEIELPYEFNKVSIKITKLIQWRQDWHNDECN